MYIKVSVIPSLTLIFLIALCAALGRWQIDRIHQKDKILQETDIASQFPTSPLSLIELDSLEAQEAARYRKVHFSAKRLPNQQFLLDNQIRDSQSGYNVLTPYELPGNQIVIVDRGWIVANSDRRSLPDVSFLSSPGLQMISGSIYVPYSSLFWDTFQDFFHQETDAKNDESWPKLLLNINFDWIEKKLERPTLPIIVRMSPDAPQKGYLREWPKMDPTAVNVHLGYTVQWFALALLFLGLLAGIAVKKGKRP